ncbi:MAG: glycosyl transferase family 1, partial [Polaribacter sp.]
MKALIITYHWPPGGGSGVQRWLKFVKYLPEFGVEPIVYCPENPNYLKTD